MLTEIKHICIHKTSLINLKKLESGRVRALTTVELYTSAIENTQKGVKYLETKQFK